MDRSTLINKSKLTLEKDSVRIIRRTDNISFYATYYEDRWGNGYFKHDHKIICPFAIKHRYSIPAMAMLKLFYGKNSDIEIMQDLIYKDNPVYKTLK